MRNEMHVLSSEDLLEWNENEMIECCRSCNVRWRETTGLCCFLGNLLWAGLRQEVPTDTDMVTQKPTHWFGRVTIPKGAREAFQIEHELGAS